MELVKGVELPLTDNSNDNGKEGGRGELLAQGVGKVRIGEDVGMDVLATKEKGEEGAKGVGVGAGDERSEAVEDDKTGRELLDWATTRMGDYYASRVKAR